MPKAGISGKITNGQGDSPVESQKHTATNAARPVMARQAINASSSKGSRCDIGLQCEQFTAGGYAQQR
jgi:hypothetical protein